MTRATLLAVLSVIASCSGDLASRGDAGPARVGGGANMGGEVVSTIDGHAITILEVQAAARLGGVSPAVALARLQDEQLLALAAERHGYHDDADVHRAARQARVQLMLERDVEPEVDPASIPDDEVEAAYAASGDRFSQPERRTSVHVMARLAPDASAELDRSAEEWTEARWREIAAAHDPEATAVGMRRRAFADLPFEVTVEEAPPLERTAEADTAYLSRLFSTSSVGLVTELVRSEHGWHVLVVTSIEPAVTTPREDALAELRAERVAELRSRALVALIGEAAQRTEVVINQEAAQRFLNHQHLFRQDEPGEDL